MSDAEKYSTVETLRDGRTVEIRALRPDDKDRFMAAVNLSSPESIYRRFFGPRRHFSEAEQSFFLNPDFIKHVALVAVGQEGGGSVIAGGARYVVVEPGRAEVAFMVVDKFQGQGIGAALLRHLIVIARKAGLDELSAEVLAGNAPMLKVFGKSGLPASTKQTGGTVHIALKVT
jgi:RimJ/RimL family protein N-acetyltransferase